MGFRVEGAMDRCGSRSSSRHLSVSPARLGIKDHMSIVHMHGMPRAIDVCGVHAMMEDVPPCCAVLKEKGVLPRLCCVKKVKECY